MAEFKFYMFFVWVLAMVLACWSFEVARMFARRIKKEALWRGEAADTAQRDRPPIAVILPIKGIESDTRENLAALLAQEYPRYRLLFAVESHDDPVIPLLHEIARQAGGTPAVETVIAGVATRCGQKIQNQLAAIERTTDADEILVFMDADARPAPDWLYALAQPLCNRVPRSDGAAAAARGADEKPLSHRRGRARRAPIGATTGFRFYVPRRPCEKLPDTFVSIINAAVAALLGPGWRNIAWGGSMAIRRRDFFAFGVHEAWRHALSDDYVLSWCVRKKAKRRIQFVPACLVASAADFSWAGFWEFAARQYKITRICAPAVWFTAAGAAALYLVGLGYTLLFWLLSVVGFAPAPSLTGRVDYFLLAMFLALYSANVWRGWFLLQGGISGLPGEAATLRRLAFWYTLGYPASLAVNLVALLKSAVGRTIEWRGVRYHMKNRLETTVERPARALSANAALPATVPLAPPESPAPS